MLTRQIVFLVGGRGERLGGLTAQTPKPLLPVGGRPFLDALIENTGRYGFNKVVLLAGYLGDSVVERYQDWGRARGIDIFCVVEPEAAGTAGALSCARAFLDDVFYLCNGDSLFDFNFLDLPLIETPADWLGKIALRSVPDGSRYGQVTLDGEKIVALKERGSAGPALINGGVYLIRKEILQEITVLPCSMERDIFPRIAQAGLLYGRVYDGFFLDIGVPADFARAQQDIPTHLTRPAIFFDRDGVLNFDAGHTHKISDFSWCTGAPEAIRLFNENGYYVFVVTNQAGVAKGIYDEKSVQTLHAWMNEDLANRGAHIDAFYYCPHHPDAEDARYRKTCNCRKPAPGMIHEALQKWPVDKARSLLIGDKQSDVDAAKAAGLRGILWSNSNDLHAWAQDVLAASHRGAMP